MKKSLKLQNLSVISFVTAAETRGGASCACSLPTNKICVYTCKSIEWCPTGREC